MSGERLEKVQAFGELRPGLLVICVCSVCPKRHRVILLNLANINGVNGKGYHVVPEPHRAGDPGAPAFGEWGVTERVVELGFVFRVVDDAGEHTVTDVRKPRAVPA